MKWHKIIVTDMHDADDMRIIRPAGLLKYLHTASNEQLTVNYGLTEDELRRRDSAFIQSAMNVDIYKPIYMGDEIEVTTFAEISHGVKFGRTYEVRRGGELVALAHGLFALVRISDHSFVRVDELEHTFDAEERASFTAFDSRIKPIKTEEMTAAGKFIVPYSFIDRNKHMNNTWYADILLSAVPNFSAERISAFCVSYLHEAKLGDELSLYYSFDGEKYTVKSTFADGNVNALAVMTMK